MQWALESEMHKVSGSSEATLVLNWKAVDMLRNDFSRVVWWFGGVYIVAFVMMKFWRRPSQVALVVSGLLYAGALLYSERFSGRYVMPLSACGVTAAALGLLFLAALLEKLRQRLRFVAAGWTRAIPYVLLVVATVYLILEFEKVHSVIRQEFAVDSRSEVDQWIAANLPANSALLHQHGKLLQEWPRQRVAVLNPGLKIYRLNIADAPTAVADNAASPDQSQTS